MKKFYTTLGRLMIAEHELQLGMDKIKTLTDEAKIIIGLKASDEYYKKFIEDITKIIEMMNDTIIKLANEMEEGYL